MLQQNWTLTIRLFSAIFRTHFGWVLPLWKDTIGGFCSPSRQGQTHVGGVLPFCRDAVGVFYSLSRLGQTFVGGMTSLCRDTVAVFYSPNLLDLRWVGEYFPSVEMQSVCSTAPADWTTKIGKILINNTKITYKDINKKTLQIHETIRSKNGRPNISEIAFIACTNILNIFKNQHPNKITPTDNKALQQNTFHTQTYHEQIIIIIIIMSYITYELVLASPAVSCMSGSSSLDSFRDGRQVAV